jgi:uncharacterized membrane protein HdeD (DUF308 family)
MNATDTSSEPASDASKAETAPRPSGSRFFLGVEITTDDIDQIDEMAEYAARNWGWYLFSGVVSVLFGAFMLTLNVATVWTVVILLSIWFMLTGISQIVGAMAARSWKWLYIVAGALAIIAAIVALAWPKMTLFVLAVFIGWGLLLWGVVDIVDSLMHTRAHYWWLYLIRGIVSAILGVAALAYPAATIVVLVAVIGIEAVVFGIFEIIAAFGMRHADKKWKAEKQTLGLT